MRFKDDITTLPEWTSTSKQLESLRAAKTLIEALRLQVLEL